MKTNFRKKLFGTLVLVVGLALASCTKDQVTDQLPLQEDTCLENACTTGQGEIVTIQFDGIDIDVEKVGDEYYFQGDMIVVPDEMLPDDLKSTGRTSSKWPNNVVYYDIESGMPNQARITNAIAHWETKTRLTFVKRTNEAAYIFFRKGNGCSSNVGRTGGKQYITLADGCSTGSTIHEIGHAVGLWHEQSRKDRDQYINIHFENIEARRDHNFKTYVERGYDGNEYTDALDFGSIMLYSSYAFSNNRKPTITKKDGSTFTGQRNGLSSGDVTGIHKMYPTENKTVTIKGNNQKYISRENGTDPITINRGRVGSWERFEVIKLSGNRVAFKGNNNKYLSSENGLKKMTCKRSKIGNWEAFTLVSRGGNNYNIKGSNGKYVSSNGGDSRGVTCDRTAAHSFELFVISGL